uniref:Uncharacterized protein n=1 Tax=Arundo donax TaxID=35708 RepID=A0A0A9C5R7_ARUDO
MQDELCCINKCRIHQNHNITL